MNDYPRSARNVLNRLLAPASFMIIVLPTVVVNLIVQACYALGLFAYYDSEKASYIISISYLIAVAKEAIGIIQGC